VQDARPAGRSIDRTALADEAGNPDDARQWLRRDYGIGMVTCTSTVASLPGNSGGS
jgi:hypothetical protein